MLHVSEPYIAPKAREYVNDCIDKNWFSWRGDYVEKFEEAFAKEVNAEYAIMVSSGTAALEIAYAISRWMTRHNRLLLPNFSFIATLSAAIRAGYKNIDITEINKLDLGLETNWHNRSNSTVCIVPISGLYDWTRETTSQFDFTIIDAAQALGSSIDYNKYNIGTYSFFANKFISTGEGGMIVTNDEAIAKLARDFRSLPSFEYLEETKSPRNLPQSNYRPTNIAAALGLAQLEVLEEKFQAHDEIYELYNEAIKIPGLQIQYKALEDQIPWVTRFIIDQACWANPYIVANEIIELLKENNIEAKPFYTPFSQHPLAHKYLSHEIINTAKKNAKWSHNLTGFYLPTHQNVTNENVEYIAELINDY